jgi:hypothetical protein
MITSIVEDFSFNSEQIKAKNGYAACPLSMQHKVDIKKVVIPKSDWHGDRIMCQSGVTCL